VTAPSKRDPLIVGRYAIHAEIASGGMATVHFGRLVGPIGFSRTVAIKRLHPQFAKDPDFVAMFLDEARLAARIQHPNVVPTLDVVSTDGEIFLVMEYVQGETLSRLVRTAREKGEAIPPRIVSAIIIGVLHGLHAAHEAKDERGKPLGIVHRDVSPQNILVGADGVTRVLDFGVAKAAVRLQTTREGQLKGKLAYMAPEQLQSGVVNRLTDVYAAGVLLWEALTGKRLFEAENEGQLLTMVLRANVDPPSAKAHDISPAVDAITLRALDREPSARFQTAREMAIALERASPVAMPSEVGEWVEAIAHENLTRRADRVAEIESSAHARSPNSPNSQSSRPKITSRPRGAEATETERHVLAPPPPPSQASAVTPPRSSGNLTPASVSVPSHTPSATRAVTYPSELTPSHGAMMASKRTRRKILVIDDSEVMLTRIRRSLEGDGYEVSTTSRAVGNARHIPSSDLCIIDFHMPGIDGGTVISSLKSAATSGGHTCLFYLYTSDPAISKEYQKLGFDGCFTDKGNEEALVRQVRAVFRMLSMRALKKKV
jgi:serine/threonine protein kinase